MRRSRRSSPRPSRTSAAASVRSSAAAHRAPRSARSGRNGNVSSRTSRNTPRTSAHSSPNVAERCMPEVLREGRGRATRGDRDHQLAPADERRRRPVADGDVVHHVHQHASIARFARDRRPLAGIVRRRDAQERAIEIGCTPRPSSTVTRGSSSASDSSRATDDRRRPRRHRLRPRGDPRPSLRERRSRRSRRTRRPASSRNTGYPNGIATMPPR